MVQITPWNPDDRVHIDEVYTNLSWLRDHKTPRGTSQKKLKDYGEIFQGTDRFPNPKRILIYGRPGIGKTTFSQKIAFDWANGRKEILKKFDVLLMIRLRDVCGSEDFRAVLKASKLLAADDSITVEDLHNYILQNQDKVLLVLDGYDEYHAGASSPIDRIRERDLLRDCCAIMTTRLTEIDKVRRSSDVQLEIIGFDTEEQVIEFASKYVDGEKEASQLVEYLRREKIWDIAKFPLLLLMMCLVWRDRQCKGLPKSKLELYERFVETLLYQMALKESGKSMKRSSNVVEFYREELTKIGKLALDALLQGTLYFPLDQIHTESKILSETMIRSGLFQISKLSSASPNEIVCFLHKSIQEFLAAWFIMHEAGLKDGKADCLSSIDSLSKVSKVKEILVFMLQWSEESAKAVFSLLQLVGEKEGLTEYNFAEAPITKDLSEDQRKFCTVCLDYFQFCPVAYMQAVSPLFLNSVHGVVVVGRDQRRSIAEKKVLKFLNSCKSNYLLFENSSSYEDNHYIFSMMCDLEAVIVTCYGETRSVNECMCHAFSEDTFCLKKEEQKMVLCLVLVNEWMLSQLKLPRVLTSSESPQTSLEMPSIRTTTTSRRVQKHSLSYVREIILLISSISGLQRANVNGLLPFLKRPQVVFIRALSHRNVYPGLLTRCFPDVFAYFTDNLYRLTLNNLNLTATCVSEIARSLHQAPKLRLLDLSDNRFCSAERDMANEGKEFQLLAISLKYLVHLQVLRLSGNPLGRGLIHVAKNLQSMPHLTGLRLSKTQMGEEEVLSIAGSLHNVSRLTVLDLHCNKLGQGICELCQHLHSVPHLTELNLRDTQMGEEEATAVARALEDLPELEKLNLSKNPLGHGITELSRHLSSVSKLTHLFLTEVHMTREEASELCTAVRGKEIYLDTDYHVRFFFFFTFMNVLYIL